MSLHSAQDYREWLAARSDAQLAELLALRPDLAVPPPQTLSVLAERTLLRASVQRAADDLDTTAFLVVAAFGQVGARSALVEEVAAVCAGRLPDAVVAAAVEGLAARALAWSHGGRWRVVPGLAEYVPWHVSRLLLHLPSAPVAAVPSLLAGLDGDERGILDALSRGNPSGKSRDAARDGDPARPVRRLLAKGLLAWIDDETVELPPHVGQVLRGELPLDPETPAEPDAGAAAVDADPAAAGEVLEVLRHAAALLNALGTAPAAALRAGGVGVREVKRLAKAAGVDEATVGLLLEVLAAAKLIVRGPAEDGPAWEQAEVWAPSVATDPWLGAAPAAKWVALAQAWVRMRRKPSLIGARDANDKPVNALSNEVGGFGVQLERAKVLEALGSFPGQAVDAAHLHRVLLWRLPRWSRRLTLPTVEGVLREAASLGVTGRGALTSAGRALAGGAPAPLAQELVAAALPEPLDYVLIQADLTVVAPGPLLPDLAEAVALVADLESGGAASVYRVGERSLLRALDAGRSAAELHALFRTHSRTPVPQALTYLVDDVARRHGQLRAGVAASFVRCEDPATISEVMASGLADTLALRAIAPTVVVSQAPLGELLEGLRGAGFTPAGEDATGAVVDLRPRGKRLPAAPDPYPEHQPPPSSPAEAAAMVAALRGADRALAAHGPGTVRADGSRATAAQTMALLQLAVAAKRAVSLGYVDAAGMSSHRIVRPVAVGGGQLDAVPDGGDTPVRFTLHRVTAVTLLDY